MEKSKTFTNCFVKSAIFTIEQIKFKYNHKIERDWELEEQRERKKERGTGCSGRPRLWTGYQKQQQLELELSLKLGVKLVELFKGANDSINGNVCCCEKISAQAYLSVCMCVSVRVSACVL